MQHLEVSGTSVLYIGRTVLKGLKSYSNITQDLVLIDELHAGLGVTFRIVLHYFLPSQVTSSPAPLVRCPHSDILTGCPFAEFF
jgi:hypothetical protein